MKLLKYIVVFLVINFGVLAIGNWLMVDGPLTDWYLNLEKAPWTPPGWVFGVAWTTIMICFSIYLAYLFKSFSNTTIIVLFVIQCILNIIWNYIFFNQHLIGLGLTVIIMLTFTIGVFTFAYSNRMKYKTFFILPYLIWLCLATSLNGYILFNN